MKLIVLFAHRKQHLIIFAVIFSAPCQPGQGLKINFGKAINADKRQNHRVNEQIDKQHLLGASQGLVNPFQRQHDAGTAHSPIILQQRC